jgi:hypothetical protein
MEKPQEELLEEAIAVFGSFEALLEKLPFQASTLRIIRAKGIKMSDKLRGDLERVIEARRGNDPIDVPAPAPVIEEEIPVPQPAPTPAPVAAAPVPAATAPIPAITMPPIAPAAPDAPIEVDHPEAVAALFDEATLARLARLANMSRLSPAQLVRVGTLRYMDQIEKTGEIIIRFNPKDTP